MDFYDEYFKNYFTSSKMIYSNEQLDQINYIQFYENPKKTSIIQEFKEEFILFFDKIKKNKLKRESLPLILNDRNNFNNSLSVLNTNFIDLITNNFSDNDQFEAFSKILVNYMFNFKESSDLFLIFDRINNLLKTNSSLKNTKSLFYKNPIQNFNFIMDKNNFLPSSVTQYYDFRIDESSKKFYISGFDSYYFSNFIDLSQPSIGPLYSIFESINFTQNPSFSNASKNNIFNFITHILNGNNEFIDYTPLKSIHIDKVISRILLTDKESNYFGLVETENNIQFSDEDIRLKSVIESSINGIQFTLNDVLKEGTKETSKVRSEYFIPYKKTGNKIEKIKTISELPERLDASKVLRYNRNLIAQILNMQEEMSSSYKKDDTQYILNQTNMKNAVALYVYLSIVLFYDVYKYYIDKLNAIIMELGDNNRYKKTSIQSAFEFTEKLALSLLKYKKMLLNCFYNYFLPSKITAGYGVVRNKEKGYFEIDNKLLFEFSEMKNIFPFEFNKIEKRVNEKTETVSTPEFYILDSNQDVNKFINFATCHKNIQDIYDPMEKITCGGYIGNFSRTKEINDFYGFYLFCNNIKWDIQYEISNYLFRSLKSGLPIESFSNIMKFCVTNQTKLNLGNYNTNNNFKKQIEEVFINKGYLNSLKNTSKYVIELADKKKEIVVYNIKQNSLSSLQKLKKNNELELTSALYYHKSVIIIGMIQKIITNLAVKNYLLENINRRKQMYESTVLEKTKGVQKVIKNYVNRSKINNKLKFSENNEIKRNFNNNNYWNNLYEIVQNKVIYIPVFHHDTVYFLNIFKFAKLQNENEIKDINKYMIDETNSLNMESMIVIGENTANIYKNKNYRILISDFISKMKNMSTKEFLYNLFTNTDFYNSITINLPSSQFTYLNKECNMSKEECKKRFVSQIQMKKIIDKI